MDNCNEAQSVVLKSVAGSFAVDSFAVDKLVVVVVGRLAVESLCAGVKRSEMHKQLPFSEVHEEAVMGL